MKTVPLISALLLLAALAWAAEGQQETVAETPSPELKHVLDKLDEANAALEDVEANVEYRREIPLLDEAEECDGSLEFKKPNLIHLELGKPRNEELYSNGRQWWVISHNDQQVEIYPVAESEEAASEAAFLAFGYGQSSEQLLREYEVTLEGAHKQEKAPIMYRLKFVPRDEDAPAQFSAIEVEVTDDLWLPRAFVLHESEGEIIHTFRLKKIKLNRGMKTESFTYEPPFGYVVLEPQQP